MTLILSTETIEAMRRGTEAQREAQRKKPTCSSCGQPAEWACTRFTQRYIRVYVKDLQIGDRVCRHFELGPKSGSFAVVSKVEPMITKSWDCTTPPARCNVIAVEIVIHRPGKPQRTKRLESLPHGVIRAERKEVCGALICEDCAQDPGDPHRYCPDHWLIRAMERAA